MGNEKTSVFSNGMIWFGAAVSIAEILAGTLLAPLGFKKGLMAIISGHLIGGVLMYFTGLIGARTGKNAMETVKSSFGSKGGIFFSVLNIIQLVGWTAVMIISGARAASTILNPKGINGNFLWSIIICALIILWILAGAKTLDKLNLIAMGALFLLTIALCFFIFKGKSALQVQGAISFGAAVELSAAMPISWLPLISDYTRNAKKPGAATLTSAVVYFLTSCWMYAIGLGAAIFSGQSDIAQIMMSVGIGFIVIYIIIFSTVTTTFLDAYSAGVSFSTITNKFGEKLPAVIVCIIGTILAVFTPIEQYENFLYLIGSVFAPMAAILMTDFFILKKQPTTKIINVTNFILWSIGFVVYRIFMRIDTIMGNTLPVMVIISILSVIVNGGIKYVRKNSD
jgi:putative hydroxymethylpyrimidine transporter CytX